MFSLPLHPALVHLPIGLAVFMPFFALGLVIASRRGLAPKRAFALATVLQAAVLVTGIAARLAGEEEEERVEHRLAGSELHDHEKAANFFVVSAGLTLLLFAAAAAVDESKSRGLGLAGTVATVLVLGTAFRVGHTGAKLVYGEGGLAAMDGATRAPSTDDD